MELLLEHFSLNLEWANWNILYQLSTSSQEAYQRGQSLNNLVWFVGAGGHFHLICPLPAPWTKQLELHFFWKLTKTMTPVHLSFSPHFLSFLDRVPEHAPHDNTLRLKRSLKLTVESFLWKFPLHSDGNCLLIIAAISFKAVQYKKGWCSRHIVQGRAIQERLSST